MPATKRSEAGRRFGSLLVGGVLAVALSGCHQLCGESKVGVFCAPSDLNPLNRQPEVGRVNLLLPLLDGTFADYPNRHVSTAYPAAFQSFMRDPDGDDLFLEWDLNGDGRTDRETTVDDHGQGRGQPAQWRYTSPGAVTVRLRVTDFPKHIGLPGDVSVTRAVTVRDPRTNRDPTAAFSWSPNPARANEPVRLDATGSSDPDPEDAGDLAYYWTCCPDGRITTARFGPGEPQVTLNVEDGLGRRDQAQATVTVLGPPAPGNQPPTASFTVTPTAPAAGQPVTLDASGSTDPDGPIARYDWDLDGTGGYEVMGTDKVLTRSFSDAGPRTIGLRVIDGDGAESARFSRTITVTGNQRPVARFSVIPSPAEVGESIELDASASFDPDGAVARWEWDLEGDDGFETDDGDVPNHHLPPYSAPGEYPVRLRVTDDEGFVSEVEERVVSVVDDNLRAFTAFAPPFAAGSAAAAVRPAAATLPFSARLDGRPVRGGRGHVRRRGRRLSLTGVRGRGRFRGALLDPAGRPPAAERALRRFLRAPWRTRVGFSYDRRTKRWAASGLALARARRGRVCLRFSLAALPGATATGRFRVIGGRGAGARLRASGTLRFQVKGAATALGRVTARRGRARGLPRACRRLR